MAEPTNDHVVIHQLKNHLAVIVGFCDLLIADTPDGDPREADLLDVHKAARDAMAVMPEVARRLVTTLEEWNDERQAAGARGGRRTADPQHGMRILRPAGYAWEASGARRPSRCSTGVVPIC